MEYLDDVVENRNEEKDPDLDEVLDELLVDVREDDVLEELLVDDERDDVRLDELEEGGIHGEFVH